MVAEPVPVPAWREARYGLRAVRLGEALHPGPASWRVRVRRANGAEATLSCTSAREAASAAGTCAWQLTTGRRAHGPRRETPKEALEAWLHSHRGVLDAASAEELAAWEPRSAVTQRDTEEADDASAEDDEPEREEEDDAELGEPDAAAEGQDLPAAAAPRALAPALALAPPALAPALAPAPAPAPAAPRAGRGSRSAAQAQQPLRDFSAPCWALLDGVSLLDEFALDCPTLRYVPKSARAVVADATEELCSAVLRAPERSLQELRAWKLLLLRERFLFLAPLRLSDGRRGRAEEQRLDLARLVRDRAGALLRGDWAGLLAEARTSARSLARGREKAGSVQRDESYLADEVCRKALAEEYSRAAALLGSPGLAPLSAETKGELQDLLQPPGRPLEPLEPRSRLGGAPAPFARKDTKGALRSTPRGSGAAVGGGRWEHWRAVLASPSALTALHEVLLRVATGCLPEEVATALALSKLTALRKPGGGIRPIAAPSLLRRLAGRLLVRTRKEKLAEALGRRQFAVGTAAGTEVLAHSVRALSEADPDLVVLALDAKNAYGTADREVCLRELAVVAPELLPCAELFCRRTSCYLWWDGAGHCHKLTATSGVDQGDPLAPVLFACGLAPCLAALEDELQQLARDRGLDPSKVRVLAYLDDVAVLVPPELATEAQPAAQRALGVFGLELRPEKTQAWARRGDCPAGLEQQWHECGLTLVGVPLGEPLPAGGLPAPGDDHRVDLGDEDYEAQRCKEVAGRAAALLAKLAELPTHASPQHPAVQLAALLLRHCGCGKVTHLLRSTPPASVREAARSYDAALLQAYEELAALDPLTAAQTLQCQLPLRRGGRGLRSQERLAPAAWVASWAQSVAEVLNRTGLDQLEDLEASTLPLAAACRDALASLPRAAADDAEDAELPSWRELALEPRKKVQKLLSRRLDSKNYSDCLTLLCPEERALLRSCAAPLAAAWQWASPAAPSERLDDATYRTTARALLGQAVAPAAGATCQHRARAGAGERAGQLCGAPLCSHARHAHRCGVGGGFYEKTEALERVWERIHRECGHAVDRQVHVTQWDRFRWLCTGCAQRSLAWAPPLGPCGTCGAALEVRREEAVLDLEVRSAAAPRTFYDVTVRYAVPGDAARLGAAANRDGAVAAEAEAEKLRRYPDAQAPWRCVPLATESGGRLGQRALKHLRQLARKQAENLEEGGQEAASGLVTRWGAWLSVALHRANARVLSAALGAQGGGGRDLACSLAS